MKREKQSQERWSQREETPTSVWLVCQPLMCLAEVVSSVKSWWWNGGIKWRWGRRANDCEQCFLKAWLWRAGKDEVLCKGDTEVRGGLSHPMYIPWWGRNWRSRGKQKKTSGLFIVMTFYLNLNSSWTHSEMLLYPMWHGAFRTILWSRLGG